MAMRENQGLQIALIIFVMLTVVLSVTTFLFFKKYDEELTKIASHITNVQKANRQRDEMKTERDAVKEMLGYVVNDSLDSMEKNFETDKTDMTAIGVDIDKAVASEGTDDQPVEDTNLNYRNAIDRLMAELSKRDGQIVALTEKANALNTQIVNIRNEGKEQLLAAHANTAKAVETQKQNLLTHTNQRNDFEKRRDELAEQVNETLNSLTETTEEKDREIEDLSQVLAELDKDNRVKTKALAGIKNPENIEAPDGEITWIVARQRMVFINRGSADLLRPQTTFSVFAADGGKLTASKRKGKIEVTRITGAHSAEARILENFRSDPFLPGDKIHSPVWHPGRQVHFALLGIHDIDGDGDSDRGTIRNLIHASGGVIDAEMLEKPDRTRVDVSPKEQWLKGKMTVDTRYLVLGDSPTDKSRGDGLIDAYSSFINEAKNFGVQTMNVQQFLDMMGYQADERTVGLGRGADPRDFKPRDPKTGGRRAADGFRERRPPARDDKKSAY